MSEANFLYIHLLAEMVVGYNSYPEHNWSSLIHTVFYQFFFSGILELSIVVQLTLGMKIAPPSFPALLCCDGSQNTTSNGETATSEMPMPGLHTGLSTSLSGFEIALADTRTAYPKHTSPHPSVVGKRLCMMRLEHAISRRPARPPTTKHTKLLHKLPAKAQDGRDSNGLPLPHRKKDKQPTKH
jgi:hypothetical protein